MSNFLSNVIPLIPLTLAQVPQATAGEIGSWLISFAAVAVIAHQAMGLFEKIRKVTREQPPPAETYQPIKLCEEIHKAVDHRFSEAARVDEQYRKEVRIDIKGIHNRIDDVLKAVSVLSGEIKRIK